MARVGVYGRGLVKNLCLLKPDNYLIPASSNFLRLATIVWSIFICLGCVAFIYFVLRLDVLRFIQAKGATIVQAAHTIEELFFDAKLNMIRLT